jgi:hypothetical protein
LRTIFIQEVAPIADNELEIPNVICTKNGLYEDVCDLNGIAIPSIYYDHVFQLFHEEQEKRVSKTEFDNNNNNNDLDDTSSPLRVGASVLKQVIDDCMYDTKPHEYLYLKRLIEEFPDTCETIPEYLRLANLFVAAKERLLFKLKQIEKDDYTWLTEEAVEECLRRLDDVIGEECKDQLPLVEHNIMHRDMEAEIERTNALLMPHFAGQTRKFRFHARADLITSKCIWELKCTSNITTEHQLQVVLYDWLWRIVNTPDVHKRRAVCLDPRETRIINIKTGEILRLNAEFEDLTTIVVELLKGKYEQTALKTTEEFLMDCEQFMQNKGKPTVQSLPSGGPPLGNPRDALAL